MTYRQVMDDAIGDSPVSTVDVDAVITRQRRASRMRRWGACGAGALAVLAVTVTAAQVLPGRTLTQPADGPRITTVAGTPEDLARLDNAVFAALKREVPRLRWSDPAAPDLPDWTHGTGPENTLVNYFGQGVFAVDGAQAFLIVNIERDGAQKISERRCAPPEETCRDSAGPHGERVWTLTPAREGPSAAGQLEGFSSRTVEVFRPAEDMLVRVTRTEYGSAKGVVAMTPEQQDALALDPALALAPVPPGVVVTPAPSQPSGRPTRRPVSAQQQRIDNAVLASLRRQAPDVTIAVPLADTDSSNTEDTYWGQGRIVVDGVEGLFSVQISRDDSAFGDEDVKCGKPSKSYACKAGKGPNGERYRTVTNTTRSGSATSATRDVSVLREDGSWLLVSHIADPPAGKFPLTAAQQQAIAFDRTIALTAR